MVYRLGRHVVEVYKMAGGVYKREEQGGTGTDLVKLKKVKVNINFKTIKSLKLHMYEKKLKGEAPFFST